jgi:hypothetical protein
LHDLPQIRSINKFHEEVVERAGLSEVDHRDDVWVAKARQRQRFAGESLRKIGQTGDPKREDFKRNDAIEPALTGLVNRAHAAVPKQLYYLKLRKKNTECVRRWR